MNENSLISKSRPLLNMRNSGYSLGEFKLLDLYLARINPLDVKTSRVKLSKDEYCRLMEIDSGKVRTDQLKKYTAHFLGNVVTLDRPDGKKGYIQKVLFTTAEYNEDEDEIVLECNPDPLIFNTFFNVENIGYVRYILKNTLNLKSAYSYKLFTFIKSKSPACEFKIELSELRTKLGATTQRYESFKYFNRDVLKTSIEEINANTDTYIEYERITKGRLTKAIKFRVRSQDIVDEQVDGQMDIYDYPEYCPDQQVELTREQRYIHRVNDEAFNAEFNYETAEYLIEIGKSLAQSRVSEENLIDAEAAAAQKITYYREKYLQMRAGATSKSSRSRANYLAALIKADVADSVGFKKDTSDPEKYVPKNKFSNFENRKYDFNELEKMLLLQK